MSHTTRVSEVRVHDIDALQAAVTELQSQGVNVTLERDAPCRIWGQAPIKPFVVHNHAGRFDVGFEEAKDGNGYTPIFDYHGGELYNVMGQGKQQAKTPEERVLSNIARLMQAYAIKALSNAAYQAAGTVNTVKQEDGSYIMLVQ